jgi:cytochrome c
LKRFFTAALAIVAVTTGLMFAASPAQAATAYAHLTNVHSGKCVDDPNFATGNNVGMDQWTCVSQTNENWRFERGSSNDLLIRNQSSGKCLTVLGGSTASGALIVQYTCTTANKNGQWGTTDTLAGGYDIMNAHSGLCITVEGASSGNGARLIQRACSYAASASDQHFHYPYNPYSA